MFILDITYEHINCPWHVQELIENWCAQFGNNLNFEYYLSRKYVLGSGILILHFWEVKVSQLRRTYVSVYFCFPWKAVRQIQIVTYELSEKRVKMNKAFTFFSPFVSTEWCEKNIFTRKVSSSSNTWCSQTLGLQLYEKRLQHKTFPLKFEKIFNNTIFYKTSSVATSAIRDIGLRKSVF